MSTPDIQPEDVLDDLLKADIELGLALQRLKKNKDFKKIILGMYLEDGSNIITQNLWKVKYRPNGNMDLINDELTARSLLYKFFEEIEGKHLDAIEEIKQSQEEEITDPYEV